MLFGWHSNEVKLDFDFTSSHKLWPMLVQQSIYNIANDSLVVDDSMQPTSTTTFELSLRLMPIATIALHSSANDSQIVVHL